jgi:hypothetical protein
MKKTRESCAREIVRQGDLLLVPVDGVPPDAIEQSPRGERIVLAEGEATGHAHVLIGTATEFRVRPGRSRPLDARLVLVEGSARLVHEEHDAIELAPGPYRVVRQREYAGPIAARSWRQVRD